jgi:hypothetical protein
VTMHIPIVRISGSQLTDRGLIAIASISGGLPGLYLLAPW